MHKKQLVILGAVLVLAGCGRPKLTNDQKVIVQDSLGALGSVATGVQAAHKDSKLKSGGSSPGGGTARAFGMLFGTGASTPRTEMAKFSSILSAKATEKQCVIEVEESNSSNMFRSLPTMKMRVTGAKCPIEMDLYLRLKGSAAIKTAEFRWFFEIKDPEFARYSDITKIDLKGEFSAEATAYSGTMRGSLNGSYTSQSVGDVSLSMGFNMDYGSKTMKYNYSLDLNFSDFGVTFVADALIDPKLGLSNQTWTINGEEVDQAEFMAYFGELGGKIDSSGTVTGDNSSNEPVDIPPPTGVRG